jgi:hypothetical protein
MRRYASNYRDLRENQIAAIHVYGLAGDEAAAGAAQEAHHGGKFLYGIPVISSLL